MEVGADGISNKEEEEVKPLIIALVLLTLVLLLNGKERVERDFVVVVWNDTFVNAALWSTLEDSMLMLLVMVDVLDFFNCWLRVVIIALL